MMLDDRGVHALGKVSEERKLAELARADVLCAPSLGGESFGMVLTEAFAAATPVLASDIPGYRDVVRDGVDGLLVPPGDPLALAEALRALALDRAAPRAHGARRARARRALRLAARRRRSARLPTSRRSRWPPGRAGRAAGCRAARALRPRARRPAAAVPPSACRAGSRAAAAGRPRSGALRTLRRAGARCAPRWSARASPRSRCSASASTRVAASLLASKPGLIAAGAGADVRRDVRARDRLARDPRRGARRGGAPNAATRCRARSSAC